MSSPVLARTAKFLRAPRLLRAALWIVGLAAAFIAAAFFLLPPLAKPILESQLGQALHRKLGIERLTFNPFTLEIDVGGVTIQAEDGHEVLGFDSLHADLQAVSLFKGGPVLREVRLDGPRLQITRLSADRYDISDLIDEWSKPSDSPPLPFSVSNIQIDDGKATFVDKPVGVTHTVEDLKLRLPFVSSLPNQEEIFVEPHFSARIDDAPLLLTGRSKPFAESRESELNLDLDHVDLARYLPYVPVKLPFAVRGGSLDTRLKLVFRQHDGKPAALHLTGDFHVKDVQVAEPGGAPLLAWKTLDAVVREADLLQRRFTIDSTVKDMQIVEPNGAPLLAWKTLDVAVREADLLQRRFAIDSVALAGLNGNARLDPQGKLNWLAMAERFSPPSTAADFKAKAPATPPIWSVGEVRIEDGALRFQDQGKPALAAQVVDRINAKIGGLSSEPAQKLAVAFDGRINGSGSLKAGGEVKTRPLAANLDVDLGGLQLLPLQPYFGDRLNIVLKSGQLSGKGNVSLQDSDKGLDGNFKGQLTLGDVRSIDKASETDFLKWKSLYFGKVDARLQPFALSIGEVALSDFFARMIVTPEGKLNLMQIARSPETAAAPTDKKTDADGQATAALPPAPAHEALPVNIAKITLQGGTVNFSDYFVKPNYTVNLGKISGRVTGLSSTPGSQADLEVRGTYGRAAPVQVLAKLNPLAAKTYLDLKAEIRGVDLTTLSTYSTKYAGYPIEEGKLSLFVTYKLDNNKLAADNRVFLDQLRFGDNRVDGPDATTLPVKLAVALLKNGRGEIDINLPISGSIDDPQFSVGGLVWQMIGNFFKKVVTAPFALLSSAFGGGDDISSLVFAPGDDGLDDAAIKRLEALAKAIGERPALKLEISGRADPETDREGLKRLAVENAAKAEKQKDLIKKTGGAPDLDDIDLDAQEYPVYLQRAYKEAKFPKPRNVVGMQKDLPVEEMEKLMLTHLTVGDKELRDLADRRAHAAEDWLLEQGAVPPERIFVVDPKLGADKQEGQEGKASPNRVDFALR